MTKVETTEISSYRALGVDSKENKTTTPVTSAVVNKSNSSNGDAFISSTGFPNSVYGEVLTNIRISKYSSTPILNSNDAINKSQKHLIDLIRYFEGDAKNNYNANIHNDRSDVKTYGYGLTSVAKKILEKHGLSLNFKNEEEAYKGMLYYLNDAAYKDVINVVSEKVYNQAPASIKEALLDLAYNKGCSAINKKIKKAIDDKDWPKALDYLVYTETKSSKSKDNGDVAGLYRRSLARVILASRDLPKTDAIKNKITAIYNSAKNCAVKQNKGVTDCEKMFQAYSYGALPVNESENKNTNSSKIKFYRVNQEQMSVFSIARSMRPDNLASGDKGTQLLKAIIDKIVKLNNITCDGEDNGYPKTAMQKQGTVLKLPTQIDFEGSTINLNDPAEMEDVTDNSSDVKVKETEFVTQTEEMTDSASANDKKQVNTQDNSSKGSLWSKLPVYEIAGAGVSLLAGGFVRSLPKTKYTVSALAALGLIGGNIVRKIVNKFSEGGNIEDTDCQTGFQKMLANPNTEISTSGEFEILTLNYNINKGDTIYSLSRKYGIKQNIVCNNNNIENPDIINENQNLKIHKLGYKVKKGDSIASISEKFGLNSGVIEELNGFTENTKLEREQIIEMPGYIYVVKGGDTLSEISRQVGVSVKNLKEINNLASDTIYPNQKIIVLYNDTDYDISSNKKNISVDKQTNTRIETIDMSSNNEIGNRKFFKKRKINGRTAASYECLKPTGNGKLNGKTIIINPGHGFQPSGITDNDLDIGNPSRFKGLKNEYILNYDNAFRLIERLRRQGATVLYVQGYEGKRTKGWDLVSQELRRSGRNADMFISVHANSSPTPPKKDRMEIYYHRDSKEINGKKFAKIIESKFDKYQKNDKYSESKACGLSVLTTTQSFNMPSILWEVAFMNTEEGCSRLKNNALMDKYFDLMCEGVIQYFDTYKK